MTLVFGNQELQRSDQLDVMLYLKGKWQQIFNSSSVKDDKKRLKTTHESPLQNLYKPFKATPKYLPTIKYCLKLFQSVSESRALIVRAVVGAY